jgi:hypothetical protein
MDAVNIKVHRRGDELGSNYALRDRPLNLKTVVIPLCHQDGTDAWEDDGGFIQMPYEVDSAKKFHQDIGITHLGRKQRAARLNVPRESIKVVQQGKPAPLPVVRARYEGKTEQEVRIVELECRIRELMEIGKRPSPAPTPGKPIVDLDGLIAAFQGKKIVVVKG